MKINSRILSILLLLILTGADGLAQSDEPFVLMVNGYNDRRTSEMNAVKEHLWQRGAETRVVPWNAIFDQAGDFATSQSQNELHDRLFLHQGAELLNNLPPERPLILIGHSFGADSLLKLVPRITRPIDLLVVIDPVRGSESAGKRVPREYGAIPANVRYFLNRWQEIEPWPINYTTSGQIMIADANRTQADQAAHNYQANPDGTHVTRLPESWENPVDRLRGKRYMVRSNHMQIAVDPYVQQTVIRYADLALSSRPRPSVRSNLGFAGRWESGNLVWDLETSGEQVSGRLDTLGWTHALQASLEGADLAYGQVERVNRATGGRTVMYVTLRRLDQSRFLYSTTGTDGEDDLPPDFQEEFVFTRVTR